MMNTPLLIVQDNATTTIKGIDAVSLLVRMNPIFFDKQTNRCKLCYEGVFWGNTLKYFAANEKGVANHHLTCTTCHPAPATKQIRLVLDTQVEPLVPRFDWGKLVKQK